MTDQGGGAGGGAKRHVGTSKQSFQDALHRAAEEAYKHAGKEMLFDVVQHQVVVSNPRVGEYRIVLEPADGTI